MVGLSRDIAEWSVLEERKPSVRKYPFLRD